MAGFTWNEDGFSPRVDTLSANLHAEADRLPVAHPEWFRPGDVVRIGAERLEWTGEFDEFGTPIMRATNEAVRILDEEFHIERGVGASPPQHELAGSPILIIGNASS